MAYLFKPRKKKNGQWSVRIMFTDVSRDPSRVTHTISHSKKSVMYKLAEELERKVADGEIDPWTQKISVKAKSVPTGALFGEQMEQFIKEKSRYDWNDKTAGSIAPTLRAIVREIGEETRITVKLEEQLSEIINNAPAYETCKSRRRDLNTFSGWLVANKKLPRRWELKIKARPNTASIKYITAEEVAIVQRHIIKKNRRNRDRGYWREDHNSLYLVRLIRFLFLSGLRINEALNIKVKDVFIEEGIFRIQSKGGDVETLPYSAVAPLNRIIRSQYRHLKRKGKLKANERFFEHASSKNIYKQLKEIYKEVLDPHRADELDVHSLRHGCATYLLNKNVSIKVVKEWMRHSKIETTERYAKLTQSTMGKEIGRAFE